MRLSTRLAWGLALLPLLWNANAPAAHAPKPVATPPNLSYSTYFGAAGSDQAYMAAAAPGGGVYVAGYLTDAGGLTETYVIDVSSSGAMLWDTRITGAGEVTPFYVRADAAAVYVVGVTTVRALAAASNADPAGSAKTAFISVLDPLSGAIRSSTYLGGRSVSAANVDALDPTSGDIYAGLSAGSQVEILKLDPTGTHLLWSETFGGSTASTHPYGMQTNPAGDVVVATLTTSTTYPVVAAQQSKPGGGLDTGVTQLSTQGQIMWSTYLGGSAEDKPNGLDVDPAGNVYVAGRTYSSDFPLKAALDSINPAANAAYVTSYTSLGAMRYSTYVGGGNGETWFGGISVAADGTAWLAGGTDSSTLPVIGGAPYAPKTGSYAYVVALTPGDTGYHYATYFGGSSLDGASGLLLVSGGLWVFGRTASQNFPVVAPTQTANAGGFDAWVALLRTS